MEDLGLRLKWPNDIWLKTGAGHAKICGILAEGRTQGQDVRVVLGIGLNATGPDTNLLTAGWNDLVSIDVEQLTPILHASIASLLEEHPMVEAIDRSEILATTHAAMRLTFMEGRARGERALGLDNEGRLLLPSGPIDSTEQVDWAWS
jgi:biotin-(acetyl-CoA carboxylase) ligase